MVVVLDGPHKGRGDAAIGVTHSDLDLGADRQIPTSVWVPANLDMVRHGDLPQKTVSRSAM